MKKLQWVVTREVLALGLLGVLLIICSLVLPPATGWGRLIWNLLAYGGLFGIYKLANLNLQAIGLDERYSKTGLRYALYCILAIGIVFVLVLIVDQQAFKDPRYHHSLPTALHSALLLVPLKTVLLEELAFRGLFLALVLRIKDNRWLATILSSLAFGLWHVITAASIGNYSLGPNIVVPQLVVIIAVVFVTTLAGVALAELRLRSKSLLAPILVHWFINGFAIVLAALSWRY